MTTRRSREANEVAPPAGASAPNFTDEAKASSVAHDSILPMRPDTSLQSKTIQQSAHLTNATMAPLLQSEKMQQSTSLKRFCGGANVW
jgi:hypothetical protein